MNRKLIFLNTTIQVALRYDTCIKVSSWNKPFWDISNKAIFMEWFYFHRALKDMDIVCGRLNYQNVWKISLDLEGFLILEESSWKISLDWIFLENIKSVSFLNFT